MGVTEAYREGRDLVVERPAVWLLVLATLYLAVDLAGKLAGVTLTVGGTQLVGGDLAVSTFGRFMKDGLIVGLVVGLAGVGLSMTYSILNFANFAHGDYLTTGAFSGWLAAYVTAFVTLNANVPFGEIFLLNEPALVSIVSTPLAVVVGVVVSAVVTIGSVLLLDRIVYRPMRDKGGISLLIASLGVALALRYVIVIVFSTNTRGLTRTSGVPALDIPAIDGVVPLDAHEVTLVLFAVGLMLGVHLLLQRTKLGKAMRAMADNKDLAQVTGIPTERVVRATWIIGGGLAGVAGFLIVLERGTLNFNLGFRLLLLIFAGVILGGIGSVYGAMGGGIIIGVVSRLSLVWIPSDFARVAAFLVMIVVLLYRPEGLFGGVTTA
ncbi:branched-chain amino acid ABC transporter permease [Halobacteriales archaeon QS_4_70_19]|nr:MAG: branched-chain amino acid ABC transporter permease [Halobacteriales archaeon QS_4_70_19]